MFEGDTVLRANKDGIYISDSNTKALNEEIGRLKLLLIEWEHFGTKEKVQEKIDELESMKQDQSYLTS